MEEIKSILPIRRRRPIKAADVETFLRDRAKHINPNITIEITENEIDEDRRLLIFGFKELRLDYSGKAYFFNFGWINVTVFRSFVINFGLRAVLPLESGSIGEEVKQERIEWLDKMTDAIRGIDEVEEEKPKAEEVKELPYCPKVGSKSHQRWKAHWRNVKRYYENGEPNKILAQKAKVSEDTISKVVKAGDAGLLD